MNDEIQISEDLSRAVQIGGQYGRWRVISYSHRNRHHYYNCECSCGVRRKVRASPLLHGDSKSCGCLAKEICSQVNVTHGYTRKNKIIKEYPVWRSMKERCCLPKNKNYSNYGGRGITVCDRWLSSFENFISDMGRCPIGLTLERINNNGNYEPGNCKWASPLEQALNRRTNRIIEHSGESLPLSIWAKRINMKTKNLHRLLKRHSMDYIISHKGGMNG